MLKAGMAATSEAVHYVLDGRCPLQLSQAKLCSGSRRVTAFDVQVVRPARTVPGSLAWTQTQRLY